MARFDLAFILLCCMYVDAGVPVLTPSTYYGCPNDSATFLCVLNDTVMKWVWIARNGDRFTKSYSVGNPINTEALSEEPSVTTTLRETGANTIITSLQFILVSSIHINARIQCAGTMIDRSEVTILAETYPPPTPENFTVVSSLNHTSYSVISFQWKAITRSNVEFVITTAILGQSGSTKQTQSSNIDITLQYNMVYLIVLQASNCVGRSGETALRLKFVQCKKPTSPTGVIISPYSSTSEGSVITYQCKEGSMPNKSQSTCSENSQWKPDPMTMRCTSDEAVPILLVATVSASAFTAISLLSIFLVVVLLLRKRYRKRWSTFSDRSSSTMSLKGNASAKQTGAKQVYEEKQVVHEECAQSYEEVLFYEDNDIYEEVRLDPDIWASPDEWALDSLCENPAYPTIRIK